LVIAGANHHTKPGYWESIRDSQRGNPRIEFRGYVEEQEIPELYGTSSVLVMPYDSATGASGPAHQACEFGLPMVCADIPDFRTMAADEEMAISFYETGHAADLADKLARVLESPEHQRRMAEQNFSAAVRMTMPNVVRHYLRWFELAERKRALGSTSEFKTFRRWSRGRMRHSRYSSGPTAATRPEEEIVQTKFRIVEERES
jgi:glycosyltransferase involved in cell wall biosynthesis